ncbi:MAG TPA: hypothetical protein VFO38_01920 [Candidatus Saccharimonadales bacterium]|nr:hypothetical protein [Candidatus Saccharimonadales bacterium]
MDNQTGNELQRTLFKAVLSESDPSLSFDDLESLCNERVADWLVVNTPQLKAMAAVAEAGLLLKRHSLVLMRVSILQELDKLLPAWKRWFEDYPCVGDLTSNRGILRAEFIVRLQRLATLAEGL